MDTLDVLTGWARMRCNIDLPRYSRHPVMAGSAVAQRQRCRPSTALYQFHAHVSQTRPCSMLINLLISQQTWSIEHVLDKCWVSVADGGLTLTFTTLKYFRMNHEYLTWINVLVTSFRFIWIPMLCVNIRYFYFSARGSTLDVRI